MIHDSNQESTIIIEPPKSTNLEAQEDKEDQDPCIFCISTTPPPTRYNGNCNCHPPIHADCINAWHAQHPKQCPICLIGSNEIVIRTNTYTPKYTLIFATLCCAAICCGPFIMIGVIFSLYPSGPRGHNTANSTLL